MDITTIQEILSKHSDSIDIEVYRKIVLDFAALAPNPQLFALNCGIAI